MAQYRGHRQDAPRVRDPHAVDDIEGFNALRECAGRDYRDFGLRPSLIFTQLHEPAITPVLRALRFPKDRAARKAAWADHALERVSAKLTLWNWLNRVVRKFGSKQVLQL